MSLVEIEDFCRDFLFDSYGLSLSIPVCINPRLSKALGWFIHNDKTHTPIKIEISKKFLNGGNLDDIKSVLKHECIHYALYVNRKPFLDGDPYFENELLKYNACSTDTIDFKIKRNVRVYSCECQEHIFKALISRKYRCLKCKKYLEYKEAREEMV